VIIGSFHYSYHHSLEQRIKLVSHPGICGFDTEVARVLLVLGPTRDNRGVFLLPPNMPCADFRYFRNRLVVPDVKTDVYP
jgi:hypothetical protein